MNYLNTILAFLMCVYRRNSAFCFGTKTDVFYQINESFMMMMLKLKREERYENLSMVLTILLMAQNPCFVRITFILRILKL